MNRLFSIVIAAVVLIVCIVAQPVLTTEASVGTPTQQQVQQTTAFFESFNQLLEKHSTKILSMFTDKGTQTFFQTEDKTRLKEVVKHLNPMTIYQITVQPVDGSTLIATVGYTGIGSPNAYSTSQFTLLTSGKAMLIDGFAPADLSFPEGKKVSKASLKLTDEGFVIKENLKAADFLLLSVRNESSDPASGFITIYRLDKSSSYEATVAAGLPFKQEQSVASIVVVSGDHAKIAFVGFRPGDYVVVDGMLGDSWSTGPVAHFTVK